MLNWKGLYSNNCLNFLKCGVPFRPSSIWETVYRCSFPFDGCADVARTNHKRIEGLPGSVLPFANSLKKNLRSFLK